MQADAFNGYDGIYLESDGRIIEVACWAHARRKFHESRRLDAARMETALLGSASSTRSRRNSGSAVRASGSHSRWRSVPGGSPPSGKNDRGRSWDSFHTWLEAEAPKVLPKSAVRGAMNYTLGNWTALSVYPDDGWLDIDNNEGENSLRGLCIGRRNWLFVGERPGRPRSGDPFQPVGVMQASRP